MLAMEVKYENHLNLKATELRLGLPGSDEPDRQMTPRSNKRTLSDIVSEESRSTTEEDHQDTAPPAKYVYIYIYIIYIYSCVLETFSQSKSSDCNGWVNVYE